MTWVALLLADPSPCLRRLVLRELLGRGEDDAEVRELAAVRDADPLVAELLAAQEPDGAWRGGDPLWVVRADRLFATSLALTRLGYLGYSVDHPAVQRGAAYLFSRQREDGGWPLSRAPVEHEAGGEEGYSLIPLQTALPLRGLAACGYASDPRAERAYAWLLAQRLSDGAWPTGIAAGNLGRVGGYRRLAHSRWGCRTNTTAALLCLALHPQRRNSPEAQRALDLLLGRETREAYALGFELARLLGMEPARGYLTYHARYDLALVLDLCRRVGATRDDGRVAGLVEFVQGLQGPYGLWDYAPRPQAARWLTFELLRSLSGLDRAGAWLSFEPRTPFRAYQRGVRRY